LAGACAGFLIYNWLHYARTREMLGRRTLPMQNGIQPHTRALPEAKMLLQ